MLGWLSRMLRGAGGERRRQVDDRLVKLDEEAQYLIEKAETTLDEWQRVKPRDRFRRRFR
jgi:hypothetical protein